MSAPPQFLARNVALLEPFFAAPWGRADQESALPLCVELYQQVKQLPASAYTAQLCR